MDETPRADRVCRWNLGSQHSVDGPVPLSFFMKRQGWLINLCRALPRSGKYTQQRAGEAPRFAVPHRTLAALWVFPSESIHEAMGASHWNLLPHHRQSSL